MGWAQTQENRSLSRSLQCTVVSIVCLGPLAQLPEDVANRPAVLGAATVGLALGVPAESGCWQGGYTPDMCCQVNPAVNCWDGYFTYARCCTPRQVPPLSTQEEVAALKKAAPAAAGGAVSLVHDAGAAVERAAKPESDLQEDVQTPVEVQAQPSLRVQRNVQVQASPAVQLPKQTQALQEQRPPAPEQPMAQPPAQTPQPKSGEATTELGSLSKVAGFAVGDASCWRDGFTYKRCCEVPPIVAEIGGCWDKVYTERRCCGRSEAGAVTGGKTLPESAAETPIAAQGLNSRMVDEATSGVSAPVAAILAALTAPGSRQAGAAMPEVAAAAEAVEAAAAAVASAHALASGDASPVQEPHAREEEPESGSNNQAEFFRREGARRFATYFQKAHGLLNEVMSAEQRYTGMDPVQVYHILYEAVNQLVGGMQLAFEAAGRNGEHPELASETGAAGSSSNSAAMRATFLSAAVVLARLAQASRGTPLEYEDFERQATAAMALSCQDRNNGAFRQDMAQRIHWLQREVADKKASAAGKSTPVVDAAVSWRVALLNSLERRLNATETEATSAPAVSGDREDVLFERSWQMYAEDLVEAVWRPVSGQLLDPASETSAKGTLNPTDHRLVPSLRGGKGHMWQIFPSYVMTKLLRDMFSMGKSGQRNRSEQASSSDDKRASVSDADGADDCLPCKELSRIVLQKYNEFEREFTAGAKDVEENDTMLSDSARDGRSSRGMGGNSRRTRQDEINNAFFAWQLTHKDEQEGEQGRELWPELYQDSKEFAELKHLLKLSCLEYLQQVYDPTLSVMDLAQLDLSIWASVTPPSPEISAEAEEDPGYMGLAFHDHPLALISGVFYVQAGGRGVSSRTPTVFADPRGTPPFRYTRQRRDEPEDPLEPTAPFHRLAYAHAADGLAIVFPSWLVHGVPPHSGDSTRIVFAFNLHTLHGTTLSSWAKTAL